MLFSLFMGLAAVCYFFVRTLLIKIKFFFLGKKTAVSEPSRSFVIYNEGNQYWNVFKPVLNEFEKRGIAVSYLTSAKNDPFFNEMYTHVAGEYIGAGNSAFARLNLLEADIVLMTTPGLEVYQLKRSKNVKHYTHILHETGDATCYRLFGIDWFDSILLSGEYQKDDIHTLEEKRGLKQKELVVVGSPYLDVYNEKIKSGHRETNGVFTILVSPSWGNGSLLNVFGERLLDPLVKMPWRIIVRPHPQSKKSEQDMLVKLEERYRGAANLVWDYSAENLETLAKSDIMISDFSGIIFDYIFLFDKPVIYTNAFFNIEMYDASDLDHPPWRFEVVKTFGRELQESDLEKLPDIIRKAAEDARAAQARRTAKDTAWQFIGEAGGRTVDFLVAKQKELCNA
ncbi:MAG: CDP-glycerol glycerophosphotransferase family protein [Treponema sp.]|jgi:hypothetical protein|nr:CDP-glycerol glycerophosphotransferase family protein [Treponema sp.]